MNLLIYSPYNTRAIDQLAQAKICRDLGFDVFLLTQAKAGELHESFKKEGFFNIFGYNGNKSGLQFYLSQLRSLFVFCVKNKINRILAHTQECGALAGFIGRVLQIQVFYFRHNSDYIHLRGLKSEKIFNKLANFLSHGIIAISDIVKTSLEKEGVNSKKINRINLAYDFDLIRTTGKESIHKLKKEFNANIVLLYIARLDSLKRHTLAFEVLKKLRGYHKDVCLICLGQGPEEETLKSWIKKEDAQTYIHLMGHVTNVFDYIVISDCILLLSESEASSHVPKEAGFFEKPIIVCEGVGDFTDYLIDMKTGKLVPKENPVEPTVKFLIETGENQLEKMGIELKRIVTEKFDYKNMKSDYSALLLQKK